MLDSTSFQKNIIAIRTDVTDYKIGVQGDRAPAKTKTAGYSAFKIIDDDTPLVLIYQNHNLYIEGWRNKANQVFLHKNSGYDQRADKKFHYGNDYPELGFDRTASATITLDTVNGALAKAYHAKTTDKDDDFKSAFATLAIAFSEAVRFSDVMYQIIKGLPITDLDWDKHKNKDAIMVVKG